MTATSFLSRRKLLGAAAIGAAGAGMAAIGVQPAAAAPWGRNDAPRLNAALQSLANARSNLANTNAGRNDTRRRAMRAIDDAMQQVRLAQREEANNRNYRR